MGYDNTINLFLNRLVVEDYNLEKVNIADSLMMRSFFNHNTLECHLKIVQYFNNI